VFICFPQVNTQRKPIRRAAVTTVIETIRRLADNLRVERDRLRDLRRHEVIPASGRMSTSVPFFHEYMADF
jgi:hypothetical protein